MDMQGVSLIGWLHAMTCTIALISGGWNIVSEKGTGPHKLRGHVYAWSMIAANALAFFIYRFDLDVTHHFRPGANVFGFFHWLAVAALFFTLAGYYASFRQQRGFWAYTHPAAMILSYYVLAGGLINELFARVLILRPFAVTVVNGHRQFGAPAIAISQNLCLAAALILIVWFIVRVARYRRKARETVTQPA